MADVDYLIKGAGAVGLVFADQMLAEGDARIAIVDRRLAPGGHWNDAYPFVRLHQPANFYGAPSRPLFSGRLDERGLNAGLHELPSGAEVLTYFQTLMQDRLLASGRVLYFPESDMREDGSFVSRGGAATRLSFRKLVDTTYFDTQTPASRKPDYDVAEGVQITTPHRLPDSISAGQRFCVVGGGKTAMDVAVRLLQLGASPDAIRWIMPRDAWILDRATLQPGDEFFEQSLGGLARQLKASAAASDLADLFCRLECSGQLLRLDRSVRPTMFRGATLSMPEIELLRTIKDVVRLGHVRAISSRQIVLEKGAVSADPDCLHIDCTARALSHRPSTPVFAGDKITVQMVRSQLICISAAAIAHVEASYADEAEKNALCAPIPAAFSDRDWLTGTLADLRAARLWAADKPMRQWLNNQHLWGFHTTRTDPIAMSIVQRIKDARPRAEANLTRLVADLR